MFFNVWGHSITDNLCRLWFLHSEEFKSQFKDCPLVYTIKENGANSFNIKYWKNFSRLLEILGVDFDKMRLITQPTKFDKIILPEESFHGPQGRIAPKEYRETIERVRHFALKNRTSTSSKKFYFFHGRSQIGEERLAAYFKSKGYQIVSPEKLSLDEQLNLLINCESFASTLGSISHNSIFLRDNTETIYIPRAQNIFTSFQREIDNIINMNVYYVDSTTSLFSNGFYNFCYIISESLKRFFGDKFDGYEEEDFKIFLQYVKNSLSKSIECTAWVRNSYNNPTFADFLEQLRRHEDWLANIPFNFKTLQQSFSYQTHVHSRGWGDGWKNANEFSNPLDQMLDVLAIKINSPDYKVYYAVYFSEEEGWSQEATSPEMAGTVGVRKPIYGMKIRLDEAGIEKFDILYRMHKFDGEWTAWAKNGEELLSQGVKLNAIQINLAPKTKA